MLQHENTQQYFLFWYMMLCLFMNNNVVITYHIYINTFVKNVSTAVDLLLLTMEDSKGNGPLSWSLCWLQGWGNQDSRSIPLTVMVNTNIKNISINRKNAMVQLFVCCTFLTIFSLMIVINAKQQHISIQSHFF